MEGSPYEKFKFIENLVDQHDFLSDFLNASGIENLKDYENSLCSEGGLIDQLTEEQREHLYNELLKLQVWATISCLMYYSSIKYFNNLCFLSVYAVFLVTD